MREAQQYTLHSLETWTLVCRTYTEDATGGCDPLSFRLVYSLQMIGNACAGVPVGINSVNLFA